MKVLFIGSVAFSGALLKTLFTIPEAEIIGIITKSKSNFNSDHQDLSTFAVERNVPYKYVKDINAAHIIEWISSLKPEVIFCFGWSSLIKEQLIGLPPKGIIGYHPTLLPKNRGRHPLIWALALGLEKTGSTFFKMDGGADSGPIVHQVEVPISPEDTAKSLYKKMMSTAQKQLKSWVPLMQRDEHDLLEQEHTKANYWRKRGKKDGEIDFRMNSDSIINLVRALTKPYVGAHAIYEDKEFKIWSCKKGDEFSSCFEPGKILSIDAFGVTVKTGDASVILTKHALPNVLKEGDYLG
jgi:methionyl-tRNA formyltransferase